MNNLYKVHCSMDFDFVCLYVNKNGDLRSLKIGANTIHFFIYILVYFNYLLKIKI